MQGRYQQSEKFDTIQNRVRQKVMKIFKEKQRKNKFFEGSDMFNILKI